MQLSPQPTLRIIEKQKRLQKFKTLATGLLVLMAIIFLFAKYFETKVPALGFVRAFAEAAMIGAFADWFAVVALFKHPLGLKIPHTNLLANKQEAIGKNLGDFVGQNFLNKEIIETRLQTFKVSDALGKWLSEEQNHYLLAQEIRVALPSFLEIVKEEEINTLIHKRIDTFLQKTNFANVVSNLVAHFSEDNQHQKLLDLGINALKTYIETPINQKKIKTHIRENSPKLVPFFVDDMIAERLIIAVNSSLEDISENPEHSLRKEFDKMTEDFIDKLRTSESYFAHIEQIKANILEDELYQEHIGNLWGILKKEILKELENNDAKIQQKIETIIANASQKFQENSTWKNKVNNWAKDAILNLLENNREVLSSHINTTVKGWKKQEISEKLELEVGVDLQYIRFNGTLVGGMVGLLLYTIFEVLL